MHLYLDSAEWDDVRPYLDLPVVHGVTTNPTLQRHAGLRREALEGFVGRVLDAGARAVQVQVTHAEADAMVAEGETLAAWAGPGRVVVKVPATPDGLRAIDALSARGVPCTATAAFAPEQALWAALAGAHYVAPYLGRLNDAGRDGLAVIEAMQRLLQVHDADLRARRGDGPACRLLVASVRTRAEALALLELGVGALTVRPAVAGALLRHDATSEAEATFLGDAREAG